MDFKKDYGLKKNPTLAKYRCIDTLLIGGFILGALEVFAVGYLSSEYKDAIAFVVLIAVLLIKLGGLFGEQVTEII